MRIAFQGEPGAFSEAAARRIVTTRICCRASRSRRSLPPSTGGKATHGHPARSRTRSAAASIATTTCCSSTSCRSSARSSCRSFTTCWRCRARRSTGSRRVYSHPQALAQCERFLRTLTGVEIIATYDTAGSAKMVADAGPDGRRRDRVGARRRGVRPDAARLGDPGFRRQHHALPGHRPPADSATRARQDHDRLLAARTSRARSSRR